VRAHRRTEHAGEVEPGAVLLRRILGERQRRWEEAEQGRYAAAGKRAPFDWRSRYREPTAPDIAELPELPGEWTWATIDQVASPEPRSIQSGPFGSALLHSEFQGTGILAIGIDNVLDGEFSLGSQNRISLKKFEELKKFKARPFDVLMTVMATVGRCCVVPEDIETAIITKHVYRVSPNHELVDPHFLRIALSGDVEVRQQLFGEVRGQTRPGINGEILRRLAVPLAPIEEQREVVRRVATQLGTAETIARRLDLADFRADQTVQSVLAKAFRGELVPQDTADEPAAVMLERLRSAQGDDRTYRTNRRRSRSGRAR
jgi:type I restriction enzyme S subunit